MATADAAIRSPRWRRPSSAAVAVLLVVGGLYVSDRALHGAASFPGGGLAIPAWTALAGVLAWLATRLRRRWRELVLASVATALAVGVLELALPRVAPERGFPRLRGIRSQLLHHALPAHRTLFAGLWASDGGPVLVRTNGDGLRDDREREDYLAQPRRVAILGDSFVFGWGVRQEEAWPQRLEALLRQRTGEGVAVLNAGVFSYSPLLSERQWRHSVAAYRPQLVIQVLDATDVGDDWKYASEAAGGPDGAFPWPDDPDVAWHGAVWELVRPGWDELRPALLYPLRRLRHLAAPGRDYYDFRLTIDGQVETNRFFVYRHPLSVTRPYFAATWGHVERLAAEVTASGARFAVVILPRFQHWSRREAPHNWEHDQYRLDEPYQDEMFRFYDGQAVGAPFPVLDLLPAFRATDRFPLAFDRDPHLNADGNAFLAETLLPSVTAWLAAP
jgi:lysophospholipase L1-like esterase